MTRAHDDHDRHDHLDRPADPAAPRPDSGNPTPPRRRWVWFVTLLLVVVTCRRFDLAWYWAILLTPPTH
ncbi:hypothetical protein, partial [Streptomyces alkaliterrae]